MNPIKWEINKWKNEENPKVALIREERALNLFERTNLKGLGNLIHSENGMKKKLWRRVKI